MRKQTLVDFVNKFKEKFPNKQYDFSNSIYVDSHTKMIVKCEYGHTFEIRPCDLLNGYGCPICGGTKKMTKEEFIENAKIIHNNYFSYERCNFTNVNSKVIVTCPIHGDFEVKASNHLNGANCKKCSKEGILHDITLRPKRNASTKKLTTETFKEKLKEKWGDKYICPEDTEYVNNRTPINILCKEHGIFTITPNHILSGRGCPICGRNKKKTTQQIIEEIKEAQPYSDYNYDEVVYRGIHRHIKLKCNKCGTIFYNSPSNLIKNKNGCPGCNASQMEIEMRNFLDNNNIKYETEKTFEWLKNQGNMFLDFYLTDFNVTIECQGIQHFKDVNFGNSISLVEETQTRDKIKKELCEKHNIKVYYYANYHYDFPYYVYEDKNTLIDDIKLRSFNK